MIEIKHDSGTSNILLDGDAALVMAEAVSVIRALYATMCDKNDVFGEVFRDYLTEKVTSGELFKITNADIEHK